MIGIIAAIKEEFEPLLAALETPKKTEKAGMAFYTGTIGKRSTTLVMGGVGKVNAACCTQILVDVFHVDAVINAGIAGALAPGLHVGDIVVSTDAMQYDMDATAFGHPKGEIPNMAITYFPAGAALVAAAKEAADHLGIPIHTGRMMTADLGLDNAELKDELARTYGGACCEMEGAAVAQAAFINGIPYLVVRSMSDNADENLLETYEENIENAAENVARLVLGLVERA